MNARRPSDDTQTAGLVTELEFGLDDQSPFYVTLSSGDAREVRLVEQLRLDDGSFAQYYTAVGCTAQTVRERADEVTTVESTSVLEERDGSVTFRLVNTDGGLHATIEGVGAIPRSASAVDGRGRVVALVLPCVDPAAVIDAVLDARKGTELVARRQRDVDGLGFTASGLKRRFRDRLTDRQWEVLETAFQHGYFERPREHSGQEIAAKLGISSATFSQHLRTAQRAIVSLLVEETDAVADITDVE